MAVSSNFVFLTDATEPKESNAFSDYYASTLQLEVGGTASSFKLKVYMRLDDKSAYTPLAVVDLTHLSVAEEITTKGIFACGIAGVSKLKVVLSEVSGGTVTVFGRSIKD